MGAENLVPNGTRSPDRESRSELLYQLRYPGPQTGRHTTNKNHKQEIEKKAYILIDT
jgi:hypothetical protein